jgi:alpha-methylacyl-CoA racemase
MKARNMPKSLLVGIRVVDFSQYIPGPYASLMLADLGADVIKVEPPGGDPMRFYGPLGPSATSPFYSLLNGGKRVLRLDLKTDKDRRIVLDLIGHADVLIESYRPGVLERLGLGRDVLAAANPSLVHCAISNFGHTGPRARRPGHDLNCMAVGGGLIASGTSGRPVMATPPVADFASALQATTTVLAALLARKTTGRGAFIDLGMADTVLAWQSCFLTDVLRRSHLPMRNSREDNGGFANYNIYETADSRFVTLAADEEKFWANFCQAVGRGDWIARKGEAPPQSALIAEVQALFGSHELAHWNALLETVECCYQPILEPAEVLNDPQFAARGLIEPGDIDGPVVEILYPAWIDDAGPEKRQRHVDIEAGEAVRSWSRPPG